MSENEQGTFKPQFGAELNIESIIGAPLFHILIHIFHLYLL